MHLTLTYRISDEKNSDGQGLKRRHHQEKETKWRDGFCRLPAPKKADLFETAVSFSQAWQKVVMWGLDNWDKIPFTYPLINQETGESILDKEGNQKFGLTSAHYLAIWLSSRINISDSPFHSKLDNGARNQAAETLLSQFRLRQTEKVEPRRLTGEVGEVKERSFDQNQIVGRLESAVREIADLETNIKRLGRLGKELSESVSSGFEPRLIPILFPGPSDFLLFRYSKESKKRRDKRLGSRIFVCLPLFSRERGQARLPPGVVMRNGKPFRLSNKLVPLREGQDIKVPNSGQWEIFPLEAKREKDVRRLENPEYNPRTAELRFRDGIWHFNIVVEVQEPEPIKPEAFLGVHLAPYSLSWALAGTNGRILKEGLIDQSHLKNLIVESARQREYALARLRFDRLPRYRGNLKLARENAVNQILSVAKEHKAAIGIEDVSGVNKSTWSGKTNLLRSHQDFGAIVFSLSYRSVLSGLPVIRRRGRKKELFQISSFRANFTCSSCRFTNAGKPQNEHLIAEEGGQIFCGKCNRKQDKDQNAARVVVAETREFFLKKRK